LACVSLVDGAVIGNVNAIVMTSVEMGVSPTHLTDFALNLDISVQLSIAAGFSRRTVSFWLVSRADGAPKQLLNMAREHFAARSERH
jgi:hypothetical protein